MSPISSIASQFQCVYTIEDPGSAFSSPTFDDANWKTISTTVFIEAQSVWLRCLIDKFSAHQNGTVSIGAVASLDETFINGTKIGSTLPSDENYFLHTKVVNSTRRTYRVPFTTLNPSTPQLLAVHLLKNARSSIRLNPSDFILGFPNESVWPNFSEIAPSFFALFLLLVLYFTRRDFSSRDNRFFALAIFGVLVALQLFLNTFYLYRAKYFYFNWWLKLHLINTNLLILFAIQVGHHLFSSVLPKFLYPSILILCLSIAFFPAETLNLEHASHLMYFLIPALGVGLIAFFKLGNICFYQVSRNGDFTGIFPAIAGLFTLILGAYDALKMIFQDPVSLPISGIGFLLIYFSAIITTITEDKRRIRSERILFDLASQVAHDIRSPLLALGVLESDLKSISEDKRIMLRQAIQRINDIANTLLDKAKLLTSTQSENFISTQKAETVFLSDQTGTVANELIVPLVEEVVSEIRLRTIDSPELSIQFDIDRLSYSTAFSCARINPIEFKRILSNILNNSIDALLNSSEKKIQIIVNLENDLVKITVIDSGVGIPSDKLSKIGSRGFTLKNKQGNGLGLFHARQALSEWGGNFEIHSKTDIGTSVQIILPQSEPPKWLISHLTLPPHSRWAILDDDPSVHEVWPKLFNGHSHQGMQVELEHFFSSFDLIDRVKNISFEGYLIDYDFDSNTHDGFSIIEQLKIHDRAVLVTNRYDEPEIQKWCEEKKIKMIPKRMARFLKITFEGSS